MHRRRALVNLARSQRAQRISLLEALCRVQEISPLPPAMAIEWWGELVHQLGQLGEQSRMHPVPSDYPPVTDALDHLLGEVPARV